MAYQNFYATKTSTSTIGAADTTITVSVAPTVTKGRLVLEPKSAANREIISYDGVIGNVLQNVVRGLGGTTAKAHAAAVQIQMNVLGEDLQDLYDAFAAFTQVAGAASLHTITVSGGLLTISDDILVQGTIRFTPRVSIAASAATLTPNIDNFGIYDLTAQAEALTIANPTGTPRNGDGLIIRIKDNGTSRAITFGTAYANISGLDLLTATTLGKWHTIGVMYNETATKWQISSFTTET